MIPPSRRLSLREGLREARSERQGRMAIDFAFHPSIASVDDEVSGDELLRKHLGAQLIDDRDA